MKKLARTRFAPVRSTTPRLTFVRALSMLVGVVAFGTFGVMIIEGWSFTQSIFFTLITLTTVGYGDYGLSEVGKIFTAVLMVGGLAVVTYSAGRVLPALFNQQLIWERKMTDRILQLEDHFIVCGLGRIGQSVCQHLARDGVPFIGIDANPDLVSMLLDAGQLAIVGDATDDEVLDDAKIMQARALACVTGSDNENIVITMTARDHHPELLIVSRAESEEAIRKIQRAGATTVISPIRFGGVSIANAILKPNIAEFLERTQDRAEDFELAEIEVEPGSELDGLTVSDEERGHENIVLIALKRLDTHARLKPLPDERLAGGDVLIVAGDQASIHALQREAVARAAA